MSRFASQPLPVDDPFAAVDARRRYEDFLGRAMRCAQRFLPTEQAFEVAHDVAMELLAQPAEQ